MPLPDLSFCGNGPECLGVNWGENFLADREQHPRQTKAGPAGAVGRDATIVVREEGNGFITYDGREVRNE